jgi:hypothetical protein
VLRTVAALAVAIGLAVRPGGSALVAGLAVLVLVGLVAAEPLIARAVRFSIPLAVHLPGLPTRRERRDLGWVAVSCSLVVTAAGAVLVLLGLPTWLWLVLVILSAVPLVLAALDGRTKVLMARSQRVLLAKAMTAFAPDFFVYTSRPDDASYQITMWLPYLEQAGLKFAIITRNRVPALALADLTDVPVIEARGIADLETLIVPSLKAAFYVNASSGNGALVRFQHLSHIYLGHGDSDKPPSYNPTHAMYDQIFAAGPAAARRYAAHGVSIPAEKFRIVGRPQVEDIQQVETSIRSVAEPVVLYAPTWRGHVEETMLYSLPQGEQIVGALLERGARVIFRPHPFSYDFDDDARTIARIHAMLDAASRQTGRAHLWGAAAESELGIRDCINTSDAMVSDVSSVVSDYLFSGKPFAMIAVPAEPATFVTEFPWPRGRTWSGETSPTWARGWPRCSATIPWPPNGAGSGPITWATSRRPTTRLPSWTRCDTSAASRGWTSARAEATTRPRGRARMRARPPMKAPRVRYAVEAGRPMPASCWTTAWTCSAWRSRWWPSAWRWPAARSAGCWGWRSRVSGRPSSPLAGRGSPGPVCRPWWPAATSPGRCWRWLWSS